MWGAYRIGLGLLKKVAALALLANLEQISQSRPDSGLGMSPLQWVWGVYRFGLGLLEKVAALALLARLPHVLDFISQKVFVKSFCKKSIPAQIRHLIL